jgi:trans-aconitate 2-methyltransferase
MAQPTQDVYTFGTAPAAARRLALLAGVYEPGTRELLARWAPRSPEHAVDLGSGPGHTTRLLHTATGSRRSTGIERSVEFLALARAEPVPGVEYVEADVAHHPLPVDPADLVHARFLLTHLSAPIRSVRIWADAVRPGGRMILQEVARLVSREPALSRYYELVAELQLYHDQMLDIGLRLADIGAQSGLRTEHEAIRPWHPPVAAMAGLHVLNLRNWRFGRYAVAAFDPDELDALDDALLDIAHGRPCEPIEQEMAEVVLVRT